MIRFPVITIPFLIKRALAEIFISGDKSIILYLFMHCGVCMLFQTLLECLNV